MNPRFLLLVLTLLAGTALAQRNLRNIPLPDPESEKASFRVAEGFEVNLWAADPLLAKPAQISFDRKGRLWVASSETYPQLNVNQEPSDRILILEDTDGDGRADKSSVYYDKLIIPGGVLPDGTGGAYVAHGEELIHLHDSDGDGRADRREVLLSGFGSEDTHHTLHRLRWGPGGLLYMLQGYYIGSHVETLYGPRRLNGGGLWSYDTKTRRLEIHSRGLVNPWGVVFDRWGQSFQTDGAGGQGINYSFPDAVFLASPHEHRILPGLNPGRPKSCGLEVVSGGHFPPEWTGNLLTNDFRANNIDRYVLTPAESGYNSNLKDDLLASSHVSFRPIDIAMGPDGAVYVADWYSPIIQHGEVDFRDQRRDRVHGRVWRITAKGRPLVQPASYHSAGIPELLDLLKNDADWVRLNARQELKERDEEAVTKAISLWITELDPKDPAYEHHRLEALWTYQTITTHRNPQLVHELLRSPDHRVRAAAVRVLYHWPCEPEVLVRAVADPHPRVRREAVTTLGQIQSSASMPLALEVLNHPMDRFLDFALWRTCRLLEPSWLPAFQSGDLKLGKNADHLEFALKAIEKPEALAPLVAKVREGTANPSVVQLIGKIGSPADLDSLLALAGSENHPLAKAAARSLVEAMEDRGVSPRLVEQRLHACEVLLQHPETEAVLAACQLAGLWKLGTLRDEIEKRLESASPELAPAAARAVARLGNKTLLRTLAFGPGGMLHHRVAATTALFQLDPAGAAAATAQLFTQDLPQSAVEDLMSEVLLRPGGADHLTRDLAGKEVRKDVAVHATRLVEVSGNARPQLTAALARSAKLQPPPKQMEQVALEKLLVKVREGDPKRGKDIYERSALACGLCHAIAGEGGTIGPDLSSIGASAPEDYLVESLLEPSKKIKEGYRMSIITLKNKNVTSGAVLRENRNVLVLRSAFGKEIRIPKATIQSRETSPVSLMPAALTAGLPEDEFVDLVAYLASLGRTPPRP